MSIKERFQNAMRELRGTKAVSDAPDYGRSGSSSTFSDWRVPGWNWPRYKINAIDHRAELGSLDGNSLVMAVVNYTATRIPEAIPTVVTEKAGKKEFDPNHPAALLIQRPNPHHVWANYAHGCSLSWWIDGNIFFKKARNLAGQVTELWYLPHYLVQPRWPNDGKSPEVPIEKDTDSFLSHYQFNVPGRAPVLYPSKDVLHLKRGPLTELRRASSPFEPLVKELYGDDKMASFTAAIMRNMGIQVPLISPKEKQDNLSPQQAAHMKEQWMQKTTGDRAGEPVINTIPVDVEKFGFSPTELDLSSLRLIPESRVAAVTGIPAATLQLLVGLQNGTAYASSEVARQQGYEEVIIPMQSVWAEEFRWQLLPEFENSEGARFEFNTDNVRVLQEDRDALFKRESEALRAGGQTLNQFLSATGKDQLGEDGDVYYVPISAQPMTLEKINAMADVSQETTTPDPATVEAAKMMDVDNWMRSLESQMSEFINANAR